MRKLLFFDIDGTIWDYKNYIPESTIEAIRTARKNGHLAFLNSGRCKAFIREKNLLDIGFDGIISGCGTMIEYNGEVLFEKRIENDEVERIIRVMKKHDLNVILEGPRYLYADREVFIGTEDELFVEKIANELGEDLRPLTASDGDYEVQKFSGSIWGSDISGFIKELGDDYDYIIHSDEFMEVVPRGYNKGTGIKKVCEILGYDKADTISFGDSINDREMLLDSGIGVVMGNGTEEAKEFADYVTTDLMEDGIMNAMRHFKLI